MPFLLLALELIWCVYFLILGIVSPGQLDGYFGGEPPMEFFRLLAFYIASNTLSSVYWAIPYGQPEINTVLRQSQDVLKWYNNMQTCIPAWYPACKKRLHPLFIE